MNALLTPIMPRTAQAESGEPSPALEPVRTARFGDALRVHAASDTDVVSPYVPAGGLSEPLLSLSYDELASLGQSFGTAAFVASTVPQPAGTHDTPVQSAGTESSDGGPQELMLTLAPPMNPAIAAASAMAVGAQSVPAGNGSGERVEAAVAMSGGLVPARPDSMRASTSGERATSGPLASTMNLLQAAVGVNLADTRAPASVHLLATRAAGATAPMSTAGMENAQQFQLAQSQSVLLAAMPEAAGLERAIQTSQTRPDSQLAASDKPALVQALGERLHVQINRGVSHAVIRLDPPNLGTIEIVIRHEGGAVQVHMSATHGDVLRQLHGIGNALTQDLVQRNHGDVTVHVSDSSREADGRERQRQGTAHEENDAQPGRAWSEPDDGDRPIAFTLARAQE